MNVGATSEFLELKILIFILMMVPSDGNIFPQTLDTAMFEDKKTIKQKCFCRGIAMPRSH